MDPLGAVWERGKDTEFDQLRGEEGEYLGRQPHPQPVFCRIVREISVSKKNSKVSQNSKKNEENGQKMQKAMGKSRKKKCVKRPKKCSEN